ncbi:MAG: PDZ domain-containing protein [Armatimonadetes bacterium]|nr:PDZ domain-containing protein [Armatimonadota bacterium]
MTLSRTLKLSVVIVLVVSVCASASGEATNDIKREMTAAVEAVRPALVRIHVVAADYRQGREIKTESYGSGVIISPEGYAVTNHHVAMDAEHIVCTLADKREVDAKLVGTDPLADIAVIKLISPDGKPFPFASFGDSSTLEVGDRVFAMGCPYSLSQSVTMGMVSNTEMIMPSDEYDEGFTLEGENIGSIVRWIGHDALIKPGSSGGPLVNRDGKIVGINEISFGLSGAIPSNLARKVVDQLIKNGKVTRSWFGIEVQPLLESSGLEKGVLVSNVLEGCPGHKAGLKPGDVILSVGGREVVALFREDLPVFNQFVADLPVGEPVEVKILRAGEKLTLTITPSERPKAMEKQHELKGWGICASNITYLTQKEMRLESQDGVIVTSVLPSGPAGAAKPSLQEDDVIFKVGDEFIKDLATLCSITKKLTEGRDEPVPVVAHFLRGNKRLATVVKVGKEERSRPGVEVEKAWLPIDTQVLTRELAEALGLSGRTGVRITRVYGGSSAEKAGLRVGDLIVNLDGEDIPAEQEGDEDVLPALIRQYDVGAKVKLGVIREGKSIDIDVVLEASPKPVRDYEKYEDDNFEFSARDIAFSDRADGNVDKEVKGVYVESVSEGGWAALGGLRDGDVITQIDGVAIISLEDLKRVMEEISGKKPKAVVFQVRNGIHTRFIEIEPTWGD